MSEETKKAPEAETPGPAGAQTGSEETAGGTVRFSPAPGADTAGAPEAAGDAKRRAQKEGRLVQQKRTARPRL